MIRRLLEFLRTDDLPVMARPTYAAERYQTMLWGIVRGSAESAMVAIVASKTFEANKLQTTLIWQLPIVMNLFSVLWASFIRSRPRKPLFRTLIFCTAVVLGSIGLTSATWKPWGAWVFAAQIGLAHLFLCGIVTLRTSLWNLNYPATHRGRIAGRLQMAQLIAIALTTTVIGLTYEQSPDAYRFVYPAVCAIGLLSLIPLARMRVRGERAALRDYAAHRTAVSAAGAAHRPASWLSGLGEAVTILRKDRLYARYMLAQFLLGSANFFTDPILVNALTKDVQTSYILSQAILHLIPSIVVLFSVGFWARYFDRVNILRFRVHNSACWVTSYACIAAGMLVLQVFGLDALSYVVPLLIIGRIFNGLGAAGGTIGWNIGHLYFARPHQSELYMGIHIALTGLRGLCIPLISFPLAMWLGYYALLIPVTLAVLAHAMFQRQARENPDLRRTPPR